MNARARLCADKVRSTVKKARTRWQTVSHLTRFVLPGLLILLLVARWMAPYAVQRYVNRTLDRHPEYGGRIGRVHLHLIRGAYSIDHVDIVKKTGQVPVPFVSARTVDFSIAWRDLWHGALVSQVTADHARLNFVQAPRKEQSQTGIQKGWVSILEDLFPFKINRCVVRESEVWYHDFHSTPQVHVDMTNLLLTATNLTNIRHAGTGLPAGFQLHATTLGHGDLRLDLHAAPLAPQPTFQLQAAFTNVDLTALNDFLRAYAKADVVQGTLSVFAEMAAADGRFQGYVKPLVTDLKVFNAQHKNPIQVVWEAIVAVVAQTFKNHPNDRFGTEIPFSGTFDNPKVDVWETIMNVLRNTFIKAIEPGLETTVTPDQVRRELAPPAADPLRRAPKVTVTREGDSLCQKGCYPMAVLF
jgi:hypothetical protein